MEKKFGFDPRAAADRALDTDGDGYTDIEEYLNGTDPTQFVDYTSPNNNINTLGAGSSTIASSTINR